MSPFPVVLPLRSSRSSSSPGLRKYDFLRLTQGTTMPTTVTHDLWLLVLAVFAISVIETRHFLEDPVTYSTFNILFEVVSAYGTVGITTGLPTASYSFSGGLYTGSKLVLCLVMLRGRHRGLPVALDRAVRLPGDDLVRDEEEDYRIRRSMSIREV